MEKEQTDIKENNMLTLLRKKIRRNLSVIKNTNNDTVMMTLPEEGFFSKPNSESKVN